MHPGSAKRIGFSSDNLLNNKVFRVMELKFQSTMDVTVGGNSLLCDGLDYKIPYSFRFAFLRGIISSSDVSDRDGVHWEFVLEQKNWEDFECNFKLMGATGLRGGNGKPKLARLSVVGIASKQLRAGLQPVTCSSPLALFHQIGDKCESVKFQFLSSEVSNEVAVVAEVYKYHEPAVHNEMALTVGGNSGNIGGIYYTLKCSFLYDELCDRSTSCRNRKEVITPDGVHWRISVNKGAYDDFEFGLILIGDIKKPKKARFFVNRGSPYRRAGSSPLALFQKHADESGNVKLTLQPTDEVVVDVEVYKYQEPTVQRFIKLMPLKGCVPHEFDRLSLSTTFTLRNLFNVDNNRCSKSHLAEQPINVSNNIQPPKSNIKTEFLKGFKSETFGDTTVVAADGQQFRCHKDILSLRSEVLNLMFSCPMKEARENVVTFDGYDGDIVASLLSFIYTDECEIGPIADRLYVAAHHYQLERLKVLCEAALTSNLNAKSVVKTFRLAKFYHIDQLLAKCVNYMDTHKTQLSTADLLAEALELIEVNKVQTEQK